MAVADLRREMNDVLYRWVWGEYRTRVLTFLKNNLPTSGGTLGNSVNYPPGVSLAGANLYAKGALRDSYYMVVEGDWTVLGTGGTKRIRLTTDSPYAIYYANGRSDSITYHGFDYIGRTIRDINSLIPNER